LFLTVTQRLVPQKRNCCVTISQQASSLQTETTADPAS
jgi:hypothetical protein